MHVVTVLMQEPRSLTRTSDLNAWFMFKLAQSQEVWLSALHDHARGPVAESATLTHVEEFDVHPTPFALNVDFSSFSVNFTSPACQKK